MSSFHRIGSFVLRRRALVAGLVALSAIGASRAQAQPRESGLQITPDLKSTLVSKDVVDERWAISLNDDGTVTGNVFRQDGSPPSFLWCEEIVERRTDTEMVLSCYGAGPCAAAPCDVEQWQFIADVTLPVSFFEPPTSQPTTTPTPSSTPTPTVTSSPATPSPASPSPTVTSSPGENDIRCCVPDDDGPECEDRTPSECAARGGTNLGPGSCEPNPCG